MKLTITSLLLFSILLFSFNFLNININEIQTEHYNGKEDFDPTLMRLNNLEKLETYVDSIAAIRKISSNTIEYGLIAASVVRKRFFHKYATKSVGENWIASFTERILHSLNFGTITLSSNYTSDDILKKGYGFCSQINSVLIQLLQKKGIDYKIIAFKHHFAFMSRFKNDWYYFDPDQEPKLTVENRKDLRFLQNSDSMAIAYNRSKVVVQQNLGPLNFGPMNQEIAPNGILFQKITKIISRVAFLFPLLAIVYLQFKSSKIHWQQHSKVNNLVPALPSSQ